VSHFELESRPVDTASLRLVAEDGRTVSLADWRGQPVLLVFLRWLG
jgi:peroxiredoxin